MEEEDRVVVVPRQEVVLRNDAPAAVEVADESMPEDDDDAGFEFEFEFPLVGSRGSSPALAEELFADGRIRPYYPVFGRGADRGPPPAPAAAASEQRTRGQLGRLFMEETRAWNSLSSSGSTSSSSSSSAATEDPDDGGLEGLPPESYCVWAPGSSSSAAAGSPRPRPRKSASMGSSMARWRRISDLVVGRSHSDGGKGKFLFLPPPPKNPLKPATKPSPAGVGKKAAAATEIGTVAAARRMAYYGGAKQQGGAGIPRRTFLPYREELVGFFANVNGISRSPHTY